MTCSAGNEVGGWQVLVASSRYCLGIAGFLAIGHSLVVEEDGVGWSVPPGPMEA